MIWQEFVHALTSLPVLGAMACSLVLAVIASGVFDRRKK